MARGVVAVRPRACQHSRSYLRSRALLVLGTTWSLACVLCLFGCEVYDSGLLHTAYHMRDGGPSTTPADAGGDPSDADSDAQSAQPACVVTEDPSCPLRCSEICDGQDQDCDGVIDEAGPDDLCHLAHSSSVCVRGGCLIASCDHGRVDCNGDAADGCEATLTSTAHCGLCNHGCELPNAEPACSSGQCTVQRCHAGFADCDGLADNGCERPLNTLSDCGACGASCGMGLAHGIADCASGECRFVRCAAGFGDCNHDGEQLNAGDGCESDFTKPDNCGQCGQVCPASMPYCSGGTCSALQCAALQADCNGDNKDCETDLSTTQNCGACGAACGNLANADVGCIAGACVPNCHAGFRSCDDSVQNGCETDLLTNTNCGACGVTCTYANAMTACSTGSCQLTACNSGFGDCNGTVADGCEQRLNTTAHCAQCGKACVLSNATASCSSGGCQVASCNAGYGNCDGNAANGCEVNLTTAAKNCGACNQACPGNLSCQAGRCVCTSNSNCASGQTCCNGSCIDTATDAQNCGGCGSSCAGGQSCCGGSCKNLATDTKNCGSCGKQCDSNSNRCTSGQCRCASDSPCSGLAKCCSSGCKITLLCL